MVGEKKMRKMFDAKFKYLVVWFTIMGILPVFSQSKKEEPCASYTIFQKNIQNADFAIQWESIEKKKSDFIKLIRDTDSEAKKNSSVKYRIPVVVHVIHEFGPEYLSDEQIKSQIDILNEDYQKKAGTKGDGPGGNPQIEFFLAKMDPEGNCSSGITRTISSYTVQETADGSIKKLVNWDTNRYLNIWLVRSIGDKILGYSSLGRTGGNPDDDGVVIRARNFGRVGNVTPPYNLGATATHEIGHWLSLMHPFDGGCCTAGEHCEVCGDRVCDTPSEDIPTYNCPTEILNSCTEDVDDKPNLKSNYMGYYDDRCMNLFTPGQIARIWACLEVERRDIWSEDNIRRAGYYGCASEIGWNNNPAVNFKISIYPNPVPETLNIYFESNLIPEKVEDILIFDEMGRSVNIKSFKKDYNAISLDVSEFASGIYLIVLKSQGRMLSHKWIKY